MKRPLIIERPDLQSLRQRYAYAMLTLLFWILWFYLWIPLVSLVAWLFGFQLFYEQMIVLEGLQGVLDLAGWYGLVIALLGCSLLSWALYNQLRFRGREKRHYQERIKAQDLAAFYQIDPALIPRIQRAKRIIINHDQHGHIQAIKSWQNKKIGS